VEQSAETYRRLELPDSAFTGYTTLEDTGRIVALVRDGVAVTRSSKGDEVEVVLSRTPFYAESGGQVGDTGILEGPDGDVLVGDTQKPTGGIVVHQGTVRKGSLAVGDEVTARVDADRRRDIMRNHTATHLLHAALQAVLGDHAQQRGSLVAPDRLRFDFAHLKAMTPEEVEAVEHRVNEMIRDDAPVHSSRKPIDEARQTGAMMLFGEKYGDVVRVVEVDGFSREFCGGTHLRATGEIGAFVITQETSVGSGLRRIEARTGRGAEAYIRERLELLDDVTGRLGVPSPERVLDRLADLETRLRDLEQDLDRARSRIAESSAEDLLASVKDVAGVKVLAARVEASSADGLRQRIDILRESMDSGVIVLGAVIDERPRLVAAVTEDLVARGLHAGDVVKAAAARVGGGGGGRPQLAEAGGKDAGQLDAALEAVPEVVAARLDAAEA
jgi:alanyl-tRNA synthetase